MLTLFLSRHGRLRLFLCVMLGMLAPLPCRAETINVAAAADLKFALDSLVRLFQQNHPKDTVNLVFGSSGKLATQIEQGAPFDVFFSADSALAQGLVDKGLASATSVPYGVGRLVLWSAMRDASSMTLTSLTDPSITRIAIADPKHAPYGKRAEEALRAAGVWDKVAAKLVYSQNIAEAAQWVETGNAQVGLIAQALALNPTLAAKGSYWLIPQTLHTPLEQTFIITQRAQHSPLALAFAAFIASPQAKVILQKYGFAAASGNPKPQPKAP